MVEEIKKRKSEAFVVYVMQGKGSYPSIRLSKLKNDFPERKLGIDTSIRAEECWIDTIGKKIVKMSEIIHDYMVENVKR